MSMLRWFISRDSIFSPEISRRWSFQLKWRTERLLVLSGPFILLLLPNLTCNPLIPAALERYCKWSSFKFLSIETPGLWEVYKLLNQVLSRFDYFAFWAQFVHDRMPRLARPSCQKVFLPTPQKLTSAIRESWSVARVIHQEHVLYDSNTHAMQQRVSLDFWFHQLLGRQ